MAWPRSQNWERVTLSMLVQMLPLRSEGSDGAAAGDPGAVSLSFRLLNSRMHGRSVGVPTAAEEGRGRGSVALTFRDGSAPS